MKKIWHRWTKIAEVIGNFQIALIFSILYFILVVPIALVAKFNYDFFNLKKTEWNKVKDTTSSLEKLYNQ